ncbi:MAG TPA: hypothetical protein VD993_20930 [Chitinophagaceae bacterium]|nr:hypothetical protein [Chitinophagaceae bacterium]
MACNKSVSEEDSAAKQRATDFQTVIQANKYMLVSFYADKPIDYITNDADVKSETDLWPYVKVHVKDDEYFFGANGALSISQKTDRISGNDAATINGSYSVAAKGQDVSVTFVDYMYAPLEYKLHEFDNGFFTVYVDGPSGSKLYSKYARVQ